MPDITDTNGRLNGKRYRSPAASRPIQYQSRNPENQPGENGLDGKSRFDDFRNRRDQRQTERRSEVQEKPHKGSNISNVEWGLVIGATAIIDIVQFILDFFVIGLVVNRFIDIIVGMALPFYFGLRGVKLDAKKVITWVTSLALEEIPTIDALPLWTADVLATMAWDKIDKDIGKIPVVGKIAGKALDKIGNVTPKMKKVG